MTDQQKYQMAKKTFKMLRNLLPNTVCRPDRDPCKLLFPRHPMRYHVRVLPIKEKRKPVVGFWLENGCYYEILVGPSDTKLGLSLGSVQFYAKPKKFGRKKFTKQVSHILKSTKRRSPNSLLKNSGLD